MSDDWLLINNPEGGKTLIPKAKIILIEKANDRITIYIEGFHGKIVFKDGDSVLDEMWDWLAEEVGWKV